MKRILLAFILAGTYSISAQTDSAGRFTMSGVQLDIALLGSQYNQSSQRDFQNYVRENNLLNRDLGGYQSNGGFVTTSIFPAYAGAKVFFKVNGLKLKRRLTTEVFAGLRYGQTQMAEAFYNKESYDTLGTYVNPANNGRIYQVSQFNSSYYFTVVSDHLLLPFGINLSSDQKKRAWYTVGIEIAPGITFANKFSASSNLTQTDLFLTENSKLDDARSFTRGQYQNLSGEYSHKMVKGLGFSGYAALSLSGNLRLSTRIKFLDHLNLTAAVSSGLWASANKLTGSKQNLSINLSTGFRYNF